MEVIEIEHLIVVEGFVENFKENMNNFNTDFLNVKEEIDLLIFKKNFEEVTVGNVVVVVVVHILVDIFVQDL